MQAHTGVAAEMFEALSQASVNIEMVTTSEIKISVLVDRDQSETAIKTVHCAFGLDQEERKSPTIGFAQGVEEANRANSHDEIAQEVVAKLANMEDIVVSEVLLDEEQARISVRNLPDSPGVAAQLFAAVAEGAIMVDMIVQNVGHDRRANLSFTVPRVDLDQCLLLVRAVLEDWPDSELSFEREIDKLSVWGIGLRSHTGVGERMFKALADAGINVVMLNTSEILMSVVVARDKGQQAHSCLTAAFGLDG
jgi:aspartate kinase